MTTLSIPKQRDPIARIGLFAIVGAVVWTAVFGIAQPTQTVAQSDIILLATPAPTAALPTPAPGAPALVFAAPTPEPAGWLDQALGRVGAATDQFADQQAAQFDQEHAAALAEQEAAQAAYLANVGAQAAHSPRGDVARPPEYVPGPVQYTEADGTPYIVLPGPPAASAPAPASIAAAVPAISQEQAAVIGARDSNGCAPGQVFYPRTGCHTTGSGGPQPGAVGEP